MSYLSDVRYNRPNEFVFVTSGDHGQICAVCNNCDHNIWYQWLEMRDEHQKLRKILCEDCYEKER